MEKTYNLERLRDSLFARCKAFWGAGLFVKLLVFICGTLVVFLLASSHVLALLGLFFAALSEWLLWLSDRWKSASQQLHRKLDLENSFGWKIKKAELLDFMARYALNLDDFTSEPTGSYFASKEDPGPRRAVENLRESSWWSMHLAETMWWISITTIILIVVGCVFLLNFSVGNFLQASVKVSTVAQTNNQVISQASATAQAVDASVIKVVTTAILFVFSYGLFRFTTGYFVFKEKSNRAREKADQLLEKADVDHVEAIKLWQEYHLAREASPTVPSWIWKMRQKKLNALWRTTYG
jgi:hypothetical protein